MSIVLLLLHLLACPQTRLPCETLRATALQRACCLALHSSRWAAAAAAVVTATMMTAAVEEHGGRAYQARWPSAGSAPAAYVRARLVRERAWAGARQRQRQRRWWSSRAARWCSPS